MVALVMNNQ